MACLPRLSKSSFSLCRHCSAVLSTSSSSSHPVTVAVGISGGVDSAVAAALLKKKKRQDYYDVVGVHMENWDEQDEAGVCQRQREADRADAKEACDKLRIPFVTVNFVKDYWNNVFSSLLTDYERGFTPNPDVLCNRFLKFGSFYEYAKREFGPHTLIATGHYAKTQKINKSGKVSLTRALDASKDQTLFLSSVHQEPLQSTLFPLGDLYKAQVRRMAREEFGLEGLAKKRDSTGICFIGKRSFSDFIADYVPNRPGLFVHLESSGEVLGDHPGVHHYTLGQRCRLPGYHKRFYVAGRDPVTQTIYAVDARDHPSLYSSIFYIDEPHWISRIPDYSEEQPFRFMFKFQHTDWTIPALLFKSTNPSNSYGFSGKVWLSIPTRAITPGQVAVFYVGDECLGSARILWVECLSRIGLKPPKAITTTIPNNKIQKIATS